jgi:hypothetical protein
VIRYDPPELGVDFPVYFCNARGKAGHKPQSNQWQCRTPEEMINHLYNHRLQYNHRVPKEAIDGLDEDVAARNMKVPESFEHHFGRV